MGKTKNDEVVQITIKSASIQYSGQTTIRKAHKMLQLIADEEKSKKEDK